MKPKAGDIVRVKKSGHYFGADLVSGQSGIVDIVKPYHFYVMLDGGFYYAFKTAPETFDWLEILSPIEIAAKPKSVSVAATEIKSPVDINNWREWRHNIPGECVCGIPRNACTYHK